MVPPVGFYCFNTQRWWVNSAHLLTACVYSGSMWHCPAGQRLSYWTLQRRAIQEDSSARYCLSSSELACCCCCSRGQWVKWLKRWWLVSTDVMRRTWLLVVIIDDVHCWHGDSCSSQSLDNKFDVWRHWTSMRCMWIPAFLLRYGVESRYIWPSNNNDGNERKNRWEREARRCRKFGTFHGDGATRSTYRRWSLTSRRYSGDCCVSVGPCCAAVLSNKNALIYSFVIFVLFFCFNWIGESL